MTNLIRYESKDDSRIELYIDTVSGETFASIRGYARMADRDESTIRKRLKKSAELSSIETAKVPTVGGLQGAALITEAMIAEWIVTDNPDLAKVMLRAGIRAYNHYQAGYTLKLDVIKESVEEQLEEAYPRIRHLKTNRDVNPDFGDLTSVNEYLEYYQVSLTPGQYRALTRRIATTYRTLTMVDPQEKRCSFNDSRCWAYEKEYIFLVENALEVLLHGGVKNKFQQGRNKR